MTVGLKARTEKVAYPPARYAKSSLDDLAAGEWQVPVVKGLSRIPSPVPPAGCEMHQAKTFFHLTITFSALAVTMNSLGFCLSRTH